MDSIVRLDCVKQSMLEETKKAVSREAFSTTLLSFKEYENCCYLVSLGVGNGKLYEENGNGIIETETFSPNLKSNYYKSDPNFDVIIEKVYDETIILLGNLPFAFGHSFTDGLKSMWFFFTEAYSNMVKNGARPAFFVPTSFNGELPSYYKILISSLGVELENILYINSNSKIRKVIVPDLCWGYVDGEITYWEEYKNLINRITATVISTYSGDKTIYDKIYLTRTRFSNWKREVGEKQLERVYAKMGYIIISPETLQLDHQIWLLQHCNSIAATEGSVSHASIFCKCNTNLAILRKTDWVNPYQVALDQVADLNVTYIDAHKTKIVCQDEWKRMSGPFYLCITKELENYVGHRILHMPTILCPSYWWYRIRLNPWMNKNVMNRNIVHRLESYFNNRKCF